MWTRILDTMAEGVVRQGTLVLHLPDGRVIRHGDGRMPQVTMRVSDPALVRRLVLNPELALGEGYMDGTLTLDDDDVRGLLTLLARNQDNLDRMWLTRLQGIVFTGLRRAAQWNPLPKARANVAHHYDLSEQLYSLFLDADRQYSCAYFREPSMTLEQAQAAKKAHIAKKLLLKPGMRVLDIGCGWGGLGLTLARDHGVQVLGVTLSTEQHRVATERARAAGLTDRVEFRLADYRTVTGSFDRVVSVGMFEHVGVPHYREYFRHVRERLTGDGVALIHTIGRTEPPSYTSPWITKYIFPGGYVPALSEMMRAVEREGLWQTDIEVWRLHYAQTIRHWHDRFMAHLDEVRALYDDRFCRMWRYYLIASEITFREARQCVFHLQLARRQDAVPLTRDYLRD